MFKSHGKVIWWKLVHIKLSWGLRMLKIEQVPTSYVIWGSKILEKKRQYISIYTGGKIKVFDNTGKYTSFLKTGNEDTMFSIIISNYLTRKIDIIDWQYYIIGPLIFMWQKFMLVYLFWWYLKYIELFFLLSNRSIFFILSPPFIIFN